MLNFKFKPGSLKKKVVKSLKKKLQSTSVAGQTMRASPARLPDLVLSAVCPALAKTLSERDYDLKEKHTALATREARFEAAKSVEAEKQARIREGAAMMFRDNRVHSQRELVQHQQAADDLETALCEIAQDELDTVAAKYNQNATVLLLAAARHNAAAAAALEAKTEADKIGAELRKELEDAQAERTRLQALTAGAAARYEEAASLAASTTVQQDKANKYLRGAVDHCAHFEVLIEGVRMRKEELDTLVIAAKEDRAAASQEVHAARTHAVRLVIAAEAIKLIQKVTEREEAKILEDARLEAEKRMAAFADARASFYKMRAIEKGYLADRHAHLEEVQTRVDADRKKLKEEKKRIRALEIKRELEMAASVEAKRAALADLEKANNIKQETATASLVAKLEAAEDLQVAGFLRQDSRLAIDRLVAIAGEMANPIRAALRTTVPVNDDDRDGRISRMADYADENSTRIPALKRNGEGGFKVYIDTGAKDDHKDKASIALKDVGVLCPSNGGDRKRLRRKQNDSEGHSARGGRVQ